MVAYVSTARSRIQSEPALMRFHPTVPYVRTFFSPLDILLDYLGKQFLKGNILAKKRYPRFYGNQVIRIFGLG
jgi:hypothetical protein